MLRYRWSAHERLEAWLASAIERHVNKTERQDIYVLWDRRRTSCLLTLTTYSMYSMILRPRKISGILTRQKNVPKLVCVQQFCARCEEIDYCSINCEWCGRRKNSFWNYHVGDLLTYLCEPRPWANKIVAIAHNAISFELHFFWIGQSCLNGCPNLSLKLITYNWKS
jgi:hypothetical protein